MARTHYDNLKVARNAPVDVIQAAYRTLIEKYHPDRRPGDVEAERIRNILNDAYETLTDATRRRAHDEWILKEEARQQSREGRQLSTLNKAARNLAVSFKQPFNRFCSFFRRHFSKAAFIAAVLAIMTGSHYGLFSSPENDAPRTGEPYNAAPVQPVDTALPQAESPKPVPPRSQPYVRQPVSPMGQPWPAHAAYLKGYPVSNLHGVSTITVDNSLSTADAMVKLVSIGASTAFPVRVFYLPAHETFELKNVSPGKYDVRYRDLSDGSLSRSVSLTIEEDEQHYSEYKITLYSVPHGNAKIFPLNESDF